MPSISRGGQSSFDLVVGASHTGLACHVWGNFGLGSLTNAQVLNSLRTYKMTMLKVRYQGGNNIKQKYIHDKPKNS
jgi:hypothetical protein